MKYLLILSLVFLVGCQCTIEPEHMVPLNQTTQGDIVADKKPGFEIIYKVTKPEAIESDKDIPVIYYFPDDGIHRIIYGKPTPLPAINETNVIDETKRSSGGGSGGGRRTPSIPPSPVELCEESTGWIVTSYSDVNEELYAGEKEKIFVDGLSLGLYKKDFLQAVRNFGRGKADGINNSGDFLHYENDYFVSDEPIGAHGELNAMRSIATNPKMDPNTMIKIDEGLVSGIYYVEDERRLPRQSIGIYQGVQSGDSKDFFFRDVTIKICS